jgi:hypothetical protein
MRQRRMCAEPGCEDSASRGSYCEAHAALYYVSDPAILRRDERFLKGIAKIARAVRPRAKCSMLNDVIAGQGDDASPDTLTPDRILANASEGTRRVHQRGGDDT